MTASIAPTESSFRANPANRNHIDLLPYSHVMDSTKREELEKACRKENDSRVALKMVAVHIVRVRKLSIGETAANLMRSDRWVHSSGQKDPITWPRKAAGFCNVIILLAPLVVSSQIRRSKLERNRSGDAICN